MSSDPNTDPRQGPCLDCHDHCRLIERVAEAERRLNALDDRVFSVTTRALSLSNAIERLEGRVGRSLFLKRPAITIVDAVNYLDALVGEMGQRLKTLEGPRQDAGGSGSEAAPRHGSAGGGEGEDS